MVIPFMMEAGEMFFGSDACEAWGAAPQITAGLIHRSSSRTQAPGATSLFYKAAGTVKLYALPLTC